MMKHFLTASLQQGLGTVVNRSSYLLPLQRKYIISLFRDTKTNLSMAAEWKHISYIIWDLWTFLSPSLWHLYHENLFAGSGETLFSSSFSSALIKLPVESLQGGNAQKSLLCPHQHSHLLARPWKKDLWGILCLEHQVGPPFSVRAASSPRGSDLTRSWKRSSELLVHADSTASCWCRFTARIHENVPFHHIPELWQDWDLWRPSEGSELRFTFEMLWALTHGALSWWKKHHKMVHMMSSNTQVSCGV